MYLAKKMKIERLIEEGLTLGGSGEAETWNVKSILRGFFFRIDEYILLLNNFYKLRDVWPNGERNSNFQQINEGLHDD